MNNKMSEATSALELQAREHEGWLFVKINGPQGKSADLARRVWSILQDHSISQVVLELDEFAEISNDLVGQLIRLERRIIADGGVLRLSGLSPHNQEMLDLHVSHLGHRFAHYSKHDEATQEDRRPHQPR